MLRLLSCLLEKLNNYIIEFQAENIGILSVVRELKRFVILFANYIFGIDFTENENLLDIIKKLLKDASKGKHYQSSLRSMDSFEKYFLLCHLEFKTFLSSGITKNLMKAACDF